MKKVNGEISILGTVEKQSCPDPINTLKLEEKEFGVGSAQTLGIPTPPIFPPHDSACCCALGSGMLEKDKDIIL